MANQYVAKTRVGVDINREVNGQVQTATHWYSDGEVITVAIPDEELKQLISNGSIQVNQLPDPVKADEKK